MNHLALLSVWAAAASCDALSITNNVVSSKRVARKSSSLPHHHRSIAPSLNLSLLPDTHDDGINLDRIDDADFCFSTPLVGRTKHSSELNLNTLFGWKDMLHNFFLSNEQPLRINLNQALCAAAMSVMIGMHPLSALAYDSNNGVMSDGLNYQHGAVASTALNTNNNYDNDAIKSTSILTAATSSELKVKIDDSINTKSPSQITSSSSSNSKLSMGVKIEYYPEEIEEMKLLQAERDELERMARVEQDMMDVQQQQLQQLVEKKKIVEEKVVEEKAATLAASAAKTTSSSITSPTTSAKEEPTQQQLSSPPISLAENTPQTSSPPKKINSEKEELIKILRDTSTTSEITKQTLSSPSQVAVKPIQNDIDVMVNEGDGNLQLIQLVGLGAVGAGLLVPVISKKESEDDDDTKSDENSNSKILSTISSPTTTGTSPPPLGKYKPKPPSKPPIQPSDTQLNKVLGLLEDDLQELNKNLELLENDLLELNEDLDLLQDEEDVSNLVGGDDGGGGVTVSNGSYLDSLAGGSQFETKPSGTGFQSLYLGGLGGAAPLEFNYDESTAAVEEEYVANYENDQTSNTSTDEDQYDSNHPSDLSNQSPTLPSMAGASTATASYGSYLDSLEISIQSETKRYGTGGFQSLYLGGLGEAAPLEFEYEESTAALEEEYAAKYGNVVQTSNASTDIDQYESHQAEELEQIDIPSASTVSKGSYLDSLTDGNPTEATGSYLDSLAIGTQRLGSSNLGGLGSYLDTLARRKTDSKPSGAGLSSYLNGLGSASTPLKFRYVGSTSALEEECTSNYDNADTTYASSNADQYEIDEVEELPSPSKSTLLSTGVTFPTSANAQQRIISTTSGRKLSIGARITSDVNIDRETPPKFRGQSSSTRLQMFGMTHLRGRQPTRLYMSQQSNEEESLFPSTDALIEVLRQQKMEKDRRDAELRAQQQQQQQAEREAQEAATSKAMQEEEERILAEQQAKEQKERFAAEVLRAREEAEQRVREQEKRLLAEQRAKEDAALEMQLQMRMMAAEKKAEEERMMEQFLMEQRAKEEEEAGKLRRQQEEVERLAEERRRREEEEAELRAWEEKQERLLLEEKAKEEAEMKVFEERLAAEQRAKEEAELMAIEQNMSYLSDALAQVDDRLDALNSYESEVEYLDIDDGIQYLNSAVAEIDDLLSEGDT